MEKPEITQENSTIINNKKRNNNNATTSSSSSLPTPNSSPTKANTQDDEEPKAKIQRECYIMRNPNFNLKITFAKPPSLNNNNDKQPDEASKVEVEPPVHVISNNNNNNNNKPNKMKMKKKPANNKLSFVDHNNDATKATIIEHVTRNMGYNKEDIREVKIIMEKKMTPSDIEPQQARLALPAGSPKKLDASFLRNDEKEFLKVADINVNVIMGSSVHEMPLARWNYFVDKDKKKNDNNINNNNEENDDDDPGFKYVLKSGLRRQWPKLKKENGLKTDDHILVATFRYNDALHFAIIKGKPVMLFGTAIAHKYT